MASERHPRRWWQRTVRQWKRSGLTAQEFGRRHGVSQRTLLWWSSMLGRATRAGRESTSLVPLEVRVAAPAPVALRPASRGGPIEIAVGASLVRVEVGTDVEYVGALVAQLGAAR
jgi:transposase